MRRLSFQAVFELTKAFPPPSVIVDVREPSECAEGMIPTAINIPLATIPAAVKKTAEEFKSSYGVPKPDLGASIVVYCQRGGRAEKGAAAFAEAGYTNVDLYPGSWTDWSAKIKS